MKQTITILFALLASHLLLKAQDVISLTVTPNAMIRIDMKAFQANTVITLESGGVQQEVIVGASWIGFVNYNTHGEMLTITGDLERIDFSNNNSKITGVDLSKSMKLKYIYCWGNSLTELDASKCKWLYSLSCSDNFITKLNASGSSYIEFIYCFNNQMSDCALDSLFRSLPDRTQTSAARIFIKNKVHSTNPGAEGCCDSIARNKNWRVMDFNDKLANSIDIFNANCTCEPISTNYIAMRDILVYPNPFNSVVTINLPVFMKSEKVKIEIFNIIGNKVSEINNHSNEIPLQVGHLVSGIYIFKITGNTYSINIKLFKQ